MVCSSGEGDLRKDGGGEGMRWILGLCSGG